MAVFELDRRKKNITWFILALFLSFIPMLFPVASVPDWGSDWSLYMHQARNIINGIPQLDNGFITNNRCLELSAEAYPVGFPLILSALYNIVGEDIPKFFQFQTLLLSVLGIIWFQTFRKRSGNIIALIGMLFLVYSPYMMWFRNNILSEFSFLLFQSLFILYYLFHSRAKFGWLLGVFLGVALSIRSAALPLLIGVFIFEFVQLIKYSTNSRIKYLVVEKFKAYGVLVAISLGIPLLLNKLVFNTGDNLSYFIRLYEEHGSLDYILSHVKYYLSQIHYSFFQYWQMEWFGFLCLILCIVLLPIGIVVLKGRDKVLPYILLIQFLMIISFPHKQGMRYVLPMMPLLVYIVIQGAKHSWNRYSLGNILFLLITAGFIYSQYTGVKRFNKQVRDSVTWTPYSYGTFLGWKYIKENTSSEDIFVTAFPRVLSFFTERSAYSPCNVDTEAISYDIAEKKAKYVVLNKRTNRYVPTLEPFVKEYSNSLDTAYHNGEVTILKIKQN